MEDPKRLKTGETREERLAKALRANLRRRKAQAKSRDDTSQNTPVGESSQANEDDANRC